MRKLVLLIIAVAAAACSTTQVHLHTSAISAETQKQLLVSLQDAGFKVKQRKNQLPAITAGSHIIYTPNYKTDSDLKSIEHILNSLNLPASQTHLFKLGEGIGGHSYTQGNIGLYVIGKYNEQNGDLKTIPEQTTIFDRELGSTSCSQIYILDLMEDGSAYISTQSDGKEIVKLTWKNANTSLLLTKGFKKYAYHKSVDEGQLTPTENYPEPYGCQFSHNFDPDIIRQ